MVQDEKGDSGSKREDRPIIRMLFEDMKCSEPDGALYARKLAKVTANVRSRDEMKQILTIFRAEGPQAQRLMRLCRSTRKDDLLKLREAWRQEIRSGARLSAYVEYLDAWSMGDDYIRILGDATRRRELVSGELYFRIVTSGVLATLRRHLRRKYQFQEQTTFVNVVAALAKGSGACAAPVAFAIFREVVGASVGDEELKEGSNQSLNGTAHKLAVR